MSTRNRIGRRSWNRKRLLLRRDTVRQGGVRALFQGMLPGLIKVVPAVAIAMTSSRALIAEYNRRM